MHTDFAEGRIVFLHMDLHLAASRSCGDYNLLAGKDTVEAHLVGVAYTYCCTPVVLGQSRSEDIGLAERLWRRHSVPQSGELELELEPGLGLGLVLEPVLEPELLALVACSRAQLLAVGARLEQVTWW